MATKYDPLIEEQELPSTDSFRLEDSISVDSLRVNTDDNNMERNFYQLLDNLPEELKGQIDPSQVKTAYENAKHFKILVTGKTGSGKSTLINGILGVSLPEAEEGDSIGEACTTEVTDYHVTKGNVEITVWDSPGLQDGTGNKLYLQQMKEKCGERDLTLYCIDVQQKRLISGGDENPDVVAMKKLTKEFGPQFWNNTVIVLTFSNYIADDVKIKHLKSDEIRAKVEKKLQEWKDQIVHILINDVKIDRDVAEKILVIPAGHYLEPDLPVCKYWLSNVWFHCLAATSSPKGQLALLKTSANRLKKDKDVRAEDFETTIELQPIVYEEKHLKTVLGAIGGAVAGTLGCGLVGSVIGIIGGPLGIIIGLAVGVVAGALVSSGTVGAISKAVIKKRKKRNEK